MRLHWIDDGQWVVIVHFQILLHCIGKCVCDSETGPGEYHGQYNPEDRHLKHDLSSHPIPRTKKPTQPKSGFRIPAANIFAINPAIRKAVATGTMTILFESEGLTMRYCLVAAYGGSSTSVEVLFGSVLYGRSRSA